MKKSTERKRINSLIGQTQRLFLNGLITASALDSMHKTFKAALRKL